MNDNQDQKKTSDLKIPEQSKWNWLCPPLKIFYKYENDPFSVYFNYYSIQFFPFIFLNLFFIFYIFLWINYIKPYLPLKWYFSSYFVISSILLSVYSSMKTHLTEPGFLPWNWSTSKKKIFTKNELKDGLANTDPQFDWAKSHERPSRATFSCTSGYFILRADHRCNWLNSWIGLKNHRFFIQSLIFLSIMFINILISTFYSWYYFKLKYHWIIFLIYLFSSLYFGFFVIEQLVLHIYRISKNITWMEIIKKKKNIYDKGLIENWEEICGSRKYFLFWLLPFNLPLLNDGFFYETQSSDIEDIQPLISNNNEINKDYWKNLPPLL